MVTINMEGDLYFAAVEDLDHELLRCLTGQTRVVVLRMKRLRAVGSSAMAILNHFWGLLRARGIRLVVCGIENDVAKAMTGSGLRAEIGEQNLFYADNKLFQSTELALARAWSMVEGERRAGTPAAGTDEAGTGDADAGDADATGLGLTARDVMSHHCIRFGYQHQLREAVWLMSEMQKRLAPATPQAFFLQDPEAKLAGELSTWRLLREIKRGLDARELAYVDDAELGPLFRRNFRESITGMTRTDLPHLTEETPLGTLIRLSVAQDLPVLPICSDDGHIIGLVDQDDLLRALAAVLEPPSEEVDRV